MEDGAIWSMPWWAWMLIGFGIWSMFMSPKGACGSSKRGRRSKRSSKKSAEIARLKEELDASQAQIAALKTRLEAVETIVTDEENELRREFRRLQES
ncbi:MAG: hypothetical protein AAFW65_09025 [Pseudomonadota bacterium]